MSDVLKDYAYIIMQSEFRARPDFVPFEGSPSTEEVCIAAIAAEVRAVRGDRDTLRSQLTATQSRKAYLDVLCEAQDARLDELQDENWELKKRVAELETELAAMTEKYDDAMANLNDPKGMVWT